ncbi:hypothetical protein M0805_005344 [Coniferiporia weirii]|nr:hypothetical protein M0805_005344 [Coniferiporia weirii]
MATADLRLSFGAMFIGCLISVSFSGIGTLQAYYYVRQYGKRDSQLIKTTASIGVTGIITFMVQMFFANRVWRLSRHNVYLTVLIIVLAVIRLGSALTTTGQMIRLGHFSTFIKGFRWLFTFGLALSCLIDLLITSSLCYYLQGNRTGYSRVDDVLHRLLLYTINNGLLTTFASFLAMIFAASLPHNFLFLSVHFFIAKCYINSLLATLNSRDALRERDDSHPMALHISVEPPSNQPPFLRNQASCGPPVSFTKGNTHLGSGAPVTTMTNLGGLGGLGQATVDSVRVHINVEQTIHDDDGEIELDISPNGSVKARCLESINEKDNATP